MIAKDDGYEKNNDKSNLYQEYHNIQFYDTHIFYRVGSLCRETDRRYSKRERAFYPGSNSFVRRSDSCYGIQHHTNCKAYQDVNQTLIELSEFG